MQRSRSSAGAAFPLSYYAGGYDTLERLANLYERRDENQVCAVFEIRTAAMERFARVHGAGFCEGKREGAGLPLTCYSAK